jgi:hypothetical protein
MLLGLCLRLFVLFDIERRPLFLLTAVVSASVSKPVMLLQTMLDNPQYEWIVWTDADEYINTGIVNALVCLLVPLFFD